MECSSDSKLTAVKILIVVVVVDDDYNTLSVLCMRRQNL
jgi:hypothetical protein